MNRARNGSYLRPLHTRLLLNVRHGDRFRRASSTRVARLWTQQLRRVSDLFHVHEGVKTGYNRAFLLKRERFEHLQRKERAFFRPAMVNDSLQAGQLSEGIWVFYPYDEEGSVILQ